MASTSAGLAGLPPGVTQIIIPEWCETSVILPFLSIYHQIWQVIVKSFLRGLSGCQMYPSLFA